MIKENTSKWSVDSLEELSLKITDGSHNPPKKSLHGLPMLSARNITNFGIDFTNVRTIEEKSFEKEYDRANVEDGDVLLTIVGTIGRSSVVGPNLPKFTLQRSVALIKPKEDAKFLSYYFQSPRFQILLASHAKGTAQKGVYLKTLRAFKIEHPSPPEQRRIVAKIEELFSELDAGVASLKKGKEQLKTYRQAVLKVAFEGKLTKIENTNYTNFSDVILSSQNGISKRSGSMGDPCKVLRLADITEGEISESNPREIVLTQLEKEKYSLTKDDLLCIRVNGSPDLVGRFVRFDSPQDWAFCDHFIRYKIQNKINSKYLKYYFDTNSARRFIELNKVSSAGQNTVSQKTLGNFKVPLPEEDDQNKIVEEIESRISVCDNLEQTIDQELEQSESLRQSILKRAFEGNLI